MARTGNPALTRSAFGGFPPPASGADRMTFTGTLNKCTLMFAALLAGSAWPWWLHLQGERDLTQTLTWIGVLGSAVLALAIIFRKTLAPVLAVPYALVEGLSLGGISAFAEHRYPGAVIQAVALSFGVFVASFLVYRSGWIRVTAKFRTGVLTATLGILLTYIATLVLRIFDIPVPYIHDASPVGILFSAVVITVAALNLVLDYDFINRAVERGAPRAAEWYAAFGLIITLVWLYFSVLRMVRKVRGFRG